LKAFTKSLNIAFIGRSAEVWATLDSSQRVFALALGASVLLHALVLSIHFQFPDAFRRFSSAPPLEVVLVNSKSRSRPLKPDVLAQANLDGGGNTDENRRLKTPMPVLRSEQQGQDLQQAARRVQELEIMQRQLLTQMKQSNQPQAPSTPTQRAQTEPEQQISGSALATRALASIQREAQISRDIDEYNKRPRKQFVGARAAEYRFAQYADDWRQKVERYGNVNYPAEARGKIYGSLQLAVSIRPNGEVESIEILRSSGFSVLDRAAERIVKTAAPYPAFPPDIRKDTDILVITRTWRFAQGDQLYGE
jgi:protein TonB